MGRRHTKPRPPSNPAISRLLLTLRVPGRMMIDERGTYPGEVMARHPWAVEVARQGDVWWVFSDRRAFWQWKREVGYILAQQSTPQPPTNGHTPGHTEQSTDTK